MQSVRQRHCEGAVVQIDARYCVAYVKNRDLRKSGVHQIKKAILLHGWINNSIISCVPDVDYQCDAESNEEQLALLQLLPEGQRKIYRSGRWKLVDGLHRCAAVAALFLEGKLPHPFIPAMVMSPNMLLKDAQAVAYAENEAHTVYVFVSLLDNLTAVCRAKEQLRSMDEKINDTTVAAFMNRMNRKATGRNTALRIYASLEAHLCGEAKELLKEDAEEHLKIEHCVFSKTNLHTTKPPVYKQHPLVQVAVMKRMIAWHGTELTLRSSNRANGQPAGRVTIEHRLIKDWVDVCINVHSQIQLSNEKLEIIRRINCIREWCSGAQMSVAKSYQRAWDGSGTT